MVYSRCTEVYKLDTEQIILNSEEDAKIHLIIPLLHSLGFDEELQFEGSFSIRLGRNMGRIENNNSMRGRYDILVKYQGRNLCIFEAKSTDQNLSDRDRDQAISYARLVHPICPLAILCNGIETRIFNVITKESLNQNVVTGTGGFSFTVDLDAETQLLNEALLHFIGLSKSNLNTFCELQRTSRMQQLVGAEADRTIKKYIPSLYVKRSDPDWAYLSFINQQIKNTFVLIGPSGVGKTNWMCYTANLLTNLDLNKFSLFYAGMDLGNSLIECVANDFNLSFSSEHSNIQLLKNISALLSRESSELIIFIDAIDEWTHENPSRELDNFINTINLLNAPIKLVASCKMSVWPNFIWRNGNPSRLVINLFSFLLPSPTEEHENQRNVFPEPMILNKFSLSELEEASQKYSEGYHVTGLNQPYVKTIINDPFMLRLISEVYEQNDIPVDIREERLFRTYIVKKQTIIGDNHLRMKLSRIASCILELGNSSVFESNLGMGNHQEFEPLVHHGILQKFEDQHGRIRISFYFNPLRDYLIAMDVLKLDTLDLPQFTQQYKILTSNPIGQSVITWYYKYATPEQHAYLVETREFRALTFLQKYKDLIIRNTPKLISQLEPFTTADFGLNVHFEGLVVQEFGFSILEENSSQLNIFDSEIPREQGCPTVHFTSTNFMTNEPEEAAFLFYKKQLEEIVGNGKLNEDFIVPLLVEKLYALVHIYQKQFQLEVRNPQFSNLPISIEYLEQKLHELKAYMLAVEETFISKGDINDVEQRKAELLSQNGPLPYPKSGFGFGIGIESFPLKEIELYIAQLKAKGIESILPLLPSADVELHRGGMIEDFYSPDRKKEVVAKFYEYFLSILRIIISTNFPAYEETMLPYGTNLEVSYYESQKWPLSELWYNNGTEDHTKITFDQELHDVLYDNNYEKSLATFSHVIQCSNDLTYPSSRASHYTPLRARIYKEVKKRLNRVLGNNRITI